MHSGIIPNNLYVDLVNLNSVLTGNPCHCYDSDLLENNDFEVHLNHKPIDFIGIDQKQYQLKTNDGICVYANQKPISLAGIIGFDNTKVSLETKNIIFEVANFNFEMIKKTSQSLKIATKAATLMAKKIPL